MKIKLTKEHKSTPVDSIVEVDEITYKSLIEANIAIPYTAEIEVAERNAAILIESKKVPNIIIKGKNMSTEYIVGKVFKDLYEGKAVTGMSEGTAADGGNLVGTAISDVVGVALEGSKIWSKCRKITLPDKTNSIKVPIDNSEPWLVTGVPVAGYQVEGGQKSATKLAFGVQTLTLGKTVFYIPVTEELLQDVGMLDGFIRQYAFGKLGTTLDNLVLSGHGSNYSGILSNATYTTTVDISAAAGETPTATQLYGAVKAIYPTMNAEWYMGPADWSLMKGTFATSANLNNQLIDANNNKLVGLNVNVIPLLSRIVLADFSQYTVAVPRVNDILAVSEHVRFEYDEQVFRLVHRSAGAPTFIPRTASDSTTIGAFAATQS